MACGAISSALYLLADVLASYMGRGGYDYFSQGFSELLAWGSPKRTFVLASCVAYNVLVIAFSLGILRFGSGKKRSRFVAFLLLIYALVGIVTPAFFPAPLRGVAATARNTLHLPLTGIEVILIFASVCVGASLFGKRFHAFSIVSLLVLVGFGLWGGSFATGVAANQPTPWLGVIERVTIYGYLQWVAVLSVTLLRSPLRR